jgi:DNA end-binding protein Ku
LFAPSPAYFWPPRPPPATGAIEITEFIPAAQVERHYFDRLYYLGPDKGGDRAYRLLSRALRETDLVAIAKYAARGKQYLVMVRPLDDGLAMEQLHYADEIRPFSEVPLGEGEVKEEELKLALQLIRQAASDTFHPEKYSDEVRARMLEQIQRKVDGQEITALPTETPKTQIIDLMEALKASLAAGADNADAADSKPAKRRSGRKAS